MQRSRFAFTLFVGAALGVAPRVAAAQDRAAVMVGRVVNRESRAPVGGAIVVLVATGVTATSDSTGQFRYSGLSPGVHRFEVRAVGYEMSAWRVRLDAGEQLREFELDLLSYELPGVDVEAHGRLAEFERRRAQGMGFFFTRDEIERRHASSLSDLMRAVPGVQTTCRPRGSCAIVMTRSPRGCRPEFYLDGFLASFSVGPDFPLTGIHGIEVYRTASEAPAEFRKPELRCGVIVIWSRMGR
jgi:hypothetical protein